MAAGAGPLEHPAQQDYEQRLIQRIRDGEHEAFYELIRPYERRVFAAALTLLRNEADAEDCAQEAVLKAFKNIRQFRFEAKFSTWLIQIAINEARMRRRKQRTDLIEPIEKDPGEEGTYAPREFADWRGELLGRLRDRLWEGVRNLDDVHINGSMAHRLAQNLNIRIEGVPGETLLATLATQVAISSGAACATTSAEPSHVLRAIGLSDGQARASLRFGFHRFNTDQEVDSVVSILVDCVTRLRQTRGLGN